jgi:hypothetical protein
LKITVPVGTVDPDPWVTVAVSVTDFGAEPPALATVVVVVAVVLAAPVPLAVMATDSPAAPHPLEDTANPEMADAGT